MSTLFDFDHEPSRASTVKCGGCGTPVLERVAMVVAVLPYPSVLSSTGDLDVSKAFSCRQRACVAHVAEGLLGDRAIT